ncbi:MAG TPA: response regulator [Kofleriaceae bacterium]
MAASRCTARGLGRGTAVTFDLPIESPNRFAERPSAGAAPVVKRRVLIIEDQPDAATTLQSLLALQGHEVRTAPDGAAGLALARAFDPDVVLCDLGLPIMDGFAVARAIRADPALRDRRVVAVTGYAQPEDIARSRSAGFDSHLAKPLTLASVEAELALANRSAV